MTKKLVKPRGRRSRSKYGKTPAGYEWERNDCAVRAVATAAKVAYPICHQLFKENGRLDKQPTSVASVCNVLDRVGSATRGTWEKEKLTVSQWMEKHKKGRYVVAVRGHAFSICHGLIHDWGPNTSPLVEHVIWWAQVK